MKKLLVVALSLTMGLSMSTAAFAANETVTGESDVTIPAVGNIIAAGDETPDPEIPAGAIDVTYAINPIWTASENDGGIIKSVDHVIQNNSSTGRIAIKLTNFTKASGTIADTDVVLNLLMTGVGAQTGANDILNNLPAGGVDLGIIAPKTEWKYTFGGTYGGLWATETSNYTMGWNFSLDSVQ